MKEILPALKIIKTKTLKMNYLPLPLVDMSYQFMFSFEEPIDTIWRMGAIPYRMLTDKTLEDQLKEFGLVEWFKMATAGMTGPLPADAQWLLEVNACDLVKCEIVPVYIPKS